MCGSLKLEGQKNFTPNGNKIPCHYVEGGRGDYQWKGFARTEGSASGTRSLPDQWSSDEWQVASIKAEQFTEYRKSTGEHIVFDSTRLGCLVNNETGQLKVLTRPAKTKREVDVHHRMPSRVPKDWSLERYTQELNKFSGGTYTHSKE